MASAMPGKMPNHGAVRRYARLSFSMLPHDGSGGCVPRPRNDSADSASTAKPIVRLICINQRRDRIRQHVDAT